MSTENLNADTDDTNLDDFAAELFGQSKADPSPASEEVKEDEVEDADASNDDTQNVADDDTSANDDDDNDEDEANKPAPKKNRFQERIDDLVSKQRQAEREVEELRRKLEEATKPKEPEPAKPQPTADASTDTGPKPTDTNADGTEKYPMGEFDPGYIRDLMKHTLQEETKVREAALAEVEKQKAQDAAQAALQTEWNEKLTPAKERYPDFVEKGENMLAVFDKIEPAYGEYLTNTIMELEYGPDVFYYLASNVDEAQKIVNAGARKATAMLGRIEAKFADADAEKQLARPKTTSAPPPPAHLNKGTSVAKTAIRGDEEDVDLDAFARELFKRK